LLGQHPPLVEGLMIKLGAVDAPPPPRRPRAPALRTTADCSCPFTGFSFPFLPPNILPVLPAKDSLFRCQFVFEGFPTALSTVSPRILPLRRTKSPVTTDPKKLNRFFFGPSFHVPRTSPKRPFLSSTFLPALGRSLHLASTRNVAVFPAAYTCLRLAVGLSRPGAESRLPSSRRSLQQFPRYRLDLCRVLLFLLSFFPSSMSLRES